VASLAAAAIVAVSLPFSALYIHALNQHAALTANRVVHVGAGPGHATTVTTRASGGVAAGATAQATSSGSVTPPTAVTTRAS
jgi:flavin reductase (DIM6/NTAB) family NADH-FMN oxidoreductase RutF